MQLRPRTVRRVRALLAGLAILALVTGVQLLGAGAASAHAELVSSSPSSGARLADAPAEVALTFSEQVDLVTGGLRLLDGDGRVIDTTSAGGPTVEGVTVHWPLPPDLPQGGYVASWRVVSADSHPVAGAITFGIGTAAPAGSTDTPHTTEAPWPVVASRFLGYLGFAGFAGGLAFLLLCLPRDAAPPRGAWPVLRGSLILAVLAGLLTFLVQGPYRDGLPMSSLLDRTLLGEIGHTDFGAWVQLRIFFAIALIAVLWGDRTLRSPATRWITAALVVASAVTFSATGHAAATGLPVAAIDAVHVLCAGVWVGGLLLLAVAHRDLAERPEPLAAVSRFSALAMVCVVTIVLTGTVNAVVHLTAVDDLWRTTYGITLLVKLVLVALALLGAAASRRRLRGRVLPVRSVRLELVGGAVIFLATALLTTTAPPSTADAASSANAPAGSATVRMPLQGGRSAVVEVTPARVGRSSLEVEVDTAGGSPLALRDLALRATLEERDLGPFPIRLSRRGERYAGTFRFPLAGTWKLVLTIQDQDRTGTVTTGEVTITPPTEGSP